jgi:hypothetical protein
MLDDYHYNKPELLEVRQVNVKKQKRNRLFSWTYKLPSRNKPFYSTFEVYVPEPGFDEVVHKSEPVVMVKFQNIGRHTIESVAWEDFITSPFCDMMPEAERVTLETTISGYDWYMEEMGKAMAKMLEG